MRMIVFALAALTLMAGTAMAQTSGMGESLTQSMYCDLRGLFSGNLGMILGLLVALMGLMKMIQGSAGGGIFLIVCGVLVTFLPSLIEGTLDGLGNVLYKAGISTKPPGSGIGCGGGVGNWSTSVTSSGSSGSGTGSGSSTVSQAIDAHRNALAALNRSESSARDVITRAERGETVDSDLLAESREIVASAPARRQELNTLIDHYSRM